MTVTLYHGDCIEIMRGLPDASIDAVITDPPYPEIDREYGRMTEAAWWDMMMGVCVEVRRLLKPTGSAVFILQPNSRKVGSMRGWLWEFMAWVCREWNMVQDVWWWNTTTLPTGGVKSGLSRSSIKSCVWCGDPSCYRDQALVLLEPHKLAEYHSRYYRDKTQSSPSGHVVKPSSHLSFEKNGGVSPFNLLPIGVSGVATENAGSNGHGAGTPLELAKWWTRYIVPPGGTVLDPFVGSGTMMLAAMTYDCHGIGIDKMAKYIDMAQSRVDGAKLPLLEAA